jgi:hypothetical protein
MPASAARANGRRQVTATTILVMTQRSDWLVRCHDLAHHHEKLMKG